MAIAGAVALALQHRPIEPDPFLSQLSALAQAMEPSVASGIRHLIEWVSWPPDEAAAVISKVGLTPGYWDGWQGISPFVTSSVLWSLYAFLRTPEDYWETICTAIAVGGDVDTTAAMAGAISGAYLGLGALPSHLAHRVTDRGTWGFAELVELAHTCYTLKMQQRQVANR